MNEETEATQRAHHGVARKRARAARVSFPSWGRGGGRGRQRTPRLSEKNVGPRRKRPKGSGLYIVLDALSHCVGPTEKCELEISATPAPTP
eukprot:4440494-Prymnesium_polylepis.1